jgi:type VI secretion system secreted protein VgrG
VGPAGDEIFTDKYGRVKVQFPWDREGKNDGNSSCWVRVSSIWAGKQWGAIHIPRIGQEVVVDFLEGDPDQPIIVGSVYNADMMPPYPLPDNKTQSGIKPTAARHARQPNELRFEDKKAARYLLHAEKDHRVVEHDDDCRLGTIKRSRSRTTGNGAQRNHHDRQTAGNGGPERRHYHGKDRTETVGDNEDITIGGSYRERGAEQASRRPSRTENIGRTKRSRLADRTETVARMNKSGGKTRRPSAATTPNVAGSSVIAGTDHAHRKPASS